jgi:hypothetical protein
MHNTSEQVRENESLEKKATSLGIDDLVNTQHSARDFLRAVKALPPT